VTGNAGRPDIKGKKDKQKKLKIKKQLNKDFSIINLIK
jgi:hypothetical protein